MVSYGLEILFAGDLHRVKVSQLMCSVNHLIGFCMLQVFTERHFGMEYRLSQLIHVIIRGMKLQWYKHQS